MKTKVDSGKTYIGVVEDNNDPKKIGRVKIRVMDIFDSLKIEDLPWATPWKDLNGNSFNIPDVGKVVTVIFENGDENSPEFIFSDHYNINLETKLNDLGKQDYLSMKALIFDHKTQVYVNDSEGLKLDHKFNNVNIKESSIDLNLKDNFGKVNLGSANSQQRAILGDNFTNWFSDFLNILMGDKGGGFLGNLAAPVVATPALMEHIQLFNAIKDPKILSKNVYIVDNESVEKLDRIAEGQIGDSWQSTIEDNKLTSKEKVEYKPVDGASSTTFDKPPVDSTEPIKTSELAPAKVNDHPDIEVILELLRNKNYTIYTRPYELNIVSIRNQCINSGDKYSDEFVDKLYVLYKDDYDAWELKHYAFSTVPGVQFDVTKNWVDSKNFDTKNLEYWTSKIGTKTTMKEYFKTITNII